jgi:uncharacterized protein with HEPN domain
MSDAALLDRLRDILDALECIPRRCAGLSSAEAFHRDAEGRDRLDAICMTLIAVGEAFRQIDRQAEGKLLARYPQVDWTGVIGVRNVIAHGYFDIDVEQVYDICLKDIPTLIETAKMMIRDIADIG